MRGMKCEVSGTAFFFFFCGWGEGPPRALGYIPAHLSADANQDIRALISRLTDVFKCWEEVSTSPLYSTDLKRVSCFFLTCVTLSEGK